MKEEVKVFTGGDLATNAYLIALGDGNHLCVDAPPELMDYLRAEKLRVSALLLTHGHFDHVWDAGLVQEAFSCPIYGHPVDFPMINNPGYLVQFGVAGSYSIPQKLEPLTIPERGSVKWSFQGRDFTLFHVPGHCPGSVAFYLPELKAVFGGDVLFAEGVGRWDLPGGGRTDLLESIRTKFFTLPEETIVYPGHGPATTVGHEKANNPYLQ